MVRKTNCRGFLLVFDWHVHCNPKQITTSPRAQWEASWGQAPQAYLFECQILARKKNELMWTFVGEKLAFQEGVDSLSFSQSQNCHGLVIHLRLGWRPTNPSIALFVSQTDVFWSGLLLAIDPNHQSVCVCVCTKVVPTRGGGPLWVQNGQWWSVIIPDHFWKKFPNSHILLLTKIWSHARSIKHAVVAGKVHLPIKSIEKMFVFGPYLRNQAFFQKSLKSL